MMLKEDCERIGVLECGVAFQKIGFMFREQPIGDYGIDAIIETRDDKYLSGKLIAVQIKSGDSYFKEQKDNCVIYRGDIKHYYYWLNHSLPVIIVLSSPTTGELIWECVNKQTAKRCQEGWKISIPRKQTIPTSKEMLYDLANKQSEFTSRWTSLVLAKEWMLHINEKGSLILEVEEWINKSSGRGTFRLKSECEKEGEKILFEREILGFGVRGYESVIQELFPWANIEIDKDFYEANMDEECQRKSMISERDYASMSGKKGKELLKYSAELPSIYPYRNGAGEVDFYRLKLTLNRVGKSFIEIEHFLETGNFYLWDKISM